MRTVSSVLHGKVKVAPTQRGRQDTSEVERLSRKWHTVRLAKISVNLLSVPPMPLCIVSFVGLDGLRYSVEVQQMGYMRRSSGACNFQENTIASRER
jgi:hypothetical protein